MTPALGALYADVRAAREALFRALFALAHAARVQGADDVSDVAHDAAAKVYAENFDELERTLTK